MAFQNSIRHRKLEIGRRFNKQSENGGPKKSMKTASNPNKTGYKKNRNELKFGQRPFRSSTSSQNVEPKLWASDYGKYSDSFLRKPGASRSPPRGRAFRGIVQSKLLRGHTSTFQLASLQILGSKDTFAIPILGPPFRCCADTNSPDQQSSTGLNDRDQQVYKRAMSKRHQMQQCQ